MRVTVPEDVGDGVPGSVMVVDGVPLLLGVPVLDRVGDTVGERLLDGVLLGVPLVDDVCVRVGVTVGVTVFVAVYEGVLDPDGVTLCILS